MEKENKSPRVVTCPNCSNTKMKRLNIYFDLCETIGLLIFFILFSVMEVFVLNKFALYVMEDALGAKILFWLFGVPLICFSLGVVYNKALEIVEKRRELYDYSVSFLKCRQCGQVMRIIRPYQDEWDEEYVEDGENQNT